MTVHHSDGEAPAEIANAIMNQPLHAEPSQSGEEAETKARALGRKKLAIVGFAPGSYAAAPFNDPTWDIWSLNEAYTLPGFSRADRWFEIHIRQEVDISTRDANHINWLRACRDMPIYMIRKFDDIPMSVKYPLRDIVHHFAKMGSGADYLTNTISYMIALAIWEKQLGLQDWEYIGIWGVDMAQGGAYGQPSEYAEQRPSCEFWIGRAQAAGIYVYLPPQSDLLKAPGLYGYEGDGSQMRMKIRGRIAELYGRIGGLRQNLDAIGRNQMGMLGEIALADQIPWKDGLDAAQAYVAQRRALLIGQQQNLNNQAAAANRQIAQLEGAADDCMYWMRKYTLPTFTVENLTDLDERPHPALPDDLNAQARLDAQNAGIAV